MSFDAQSIGTLQRPATGESGSASIFTEKTIGLLTLQIPHEGDQYVCVLEVGIPLLEGGLLFKGALSNIGDDSVCDLLLFASKTLLDAVHFEKQSASEYEIKFMYTEDTWANLIIQTDPGNPQQFFGSVTQQPNRIKFIYKDIHEPITIGVITIVVVGVGLILCALNDVIGYYGNKECKKIRVDTGIGWKQGSLQLGCKVECVETN